MDKKHETDELMLSLELHILRDEINAGRMPQSAMKEALDRLEFQLGPRGYLKAPPGTLDRLKKEYGYPDDMPSSSRALILHPTESNAARGIRSSAPTGSMPSASKPAAKPGLFSRIKKRFTGGKTMGPLAAGIVGSVATAPLFMLMDRIMNGSMEDQMRKQMDISRRLEMEQMGGSAGMSGMGGADDRGLYDLISEKKYIRDMDQLASLTNGIRGSRGRGSDELAALLAGSEARMRDVQSPRMLTNAEIMSILNG